MVIRWPSIESTVDTTNLKRFLVTLLLMVSVATVFAQPARNIVLDDVSIIHADTYHVIEIHLPFRFSYLSHFPTDHGKELRIRIRPINVAESDKEAIVARESIVPRYAEVVSLDEVIYEGDINSGPQLTLLFTDNVSYEVIPDADYTHIRIVILSIE